MPGPCSRPLKGKTATDRMNGKTGSHARNQVARADYNKALDHEFKHGCNQRVVPLPKIG